MITLSAFCPVPHPGSLNILLLAAAILFAAVVAVTRRLPLAAGIAALVAVGGFDLWRRLPGSDGVLAAAMLAGAMGVALAPLPIPVWALMRPFWWLPTTLVESTGAPDLRRLLDCRSRKRRWEELVRLGFRPVGTLFMAAGLERQIFDVFLDETGTIGATWRG